MTRLLAALFGLAIATPLVLFAFGVRPEVDENRDLADVDPPELAGIWDASWFESVDQAFVDRLPLRDTAIELDREIDGTLFGMQSTDEVVVGAEGWRFLLSALDQPCLTSEQLDDLANEITRASAVTRAAGTDLHILLAPDKASIVDPALSGSLGCPQSNAAAISDLVPDVLISGYTALISTSEADGDLYFKTDSHWKSLGASYAAAALIDRILPRGWVPPIEVRTRDYETDLSRLLGNQETEIEPIVRATLEDRVVTTGSAPVLNPDGSEVPNLSSTRSHVEGGTVLPGQTVILHDSFGWALAGNLMPYFEDTTLVPRTLLVNDYNQVLLADTDTLIIERVQRSFLVDMLNFPLASSLVESLLDRLAAAPLTDRSTVIEPGGPGIDRYAVVSIAAERGRVRIGDEELEFTPANRRQAVHVDEPIAVDISDNGVTVMIVDIPREND